MISDSAVRKGQSALIMHVIMDAVMYYHVGNEKEKVERKLANSR